jgi:hypothetical protein
MDEWMELLKRVEGRRKSWTGWAGRGAAFNHTSRESAQLFINLELRTYKDFRPLLINHNDEHYLVKYNIIRRRSPSQGALNQYIPPNSYH